MPKNLVFSFKNEYKELWDRYMMLLAVFNSLYLPFEMAKFQASDHTKFQTALDYFVDLCFLLDLVLMFFSSYKNKLGIEIWEPKGIAKHYVLSIRFAVDLGSLLGQFIKLV